MNGREGNNSQISIRPSPEIQQKVQPLMNDLVKYLLAKNKPQDPVPYMVQFLSERAGRGVPELTAQERIELEKLRS